MVKRLCFFHSKRVESVLLPLVLSFVLFLITRLLPYGLVTTPSLAFYTLPLTTISPITKPKKRPDQKGQAFLARHPAPFSGEEDTITINDSVPSSLSNAIAVHIVAAQDALSIHLGFNNLPPPCVVFKSNNEWWIVLVGNFTFSYSPDLNLRETELQEIKDHQSLGCTILRLKVRRPLLVAVNTKDHQLLLDLKPQNSALSDHPPPPPITVSKDLHFSMPFSQGIGLFQIQDDDEIDDYWVIPAVSPNKISYAPYETPDFVVTSASQGQAFLIKKDGLDCAVDDKKITLSHQNGLHVTPLPLNDKLSLAKSFLIPSLFEGFDPIKAQVRRQELEKIQEKKPLEDNLSEFLELAWIHLGLGNIVESLSVLRAIEEQRPLLGKTAFIQALKGLAVLLCYRYDEAKTLLAPFSYEPEPKLWHALSYLGSAPGPIPGFQSDLAALTDVLKNLPPAITERLLGFILTNSIITKNKDVLALYTQEDLKPKTPYYQGIYALAQAAAMMESNPQEAEKRLRLLGKNKHSPQVAVMATFEWIQGRLHAKTMTVDDAIKHLEALRFQWRGDDLEYKITHLLGTLFWEKKNYPKALPLFQKLIKYFPQASARDHLPDLMSQGVFSYFKQTPPPPLMALLSFFQEYGDYALDRPEADDLMLSVTQQLADLDLAGEAANLIKDYYENRLKIGTHDHNRATKLIVHMARYMNQNKDFNSSIDWLTKVKQWPDAHKIKAEHLLATAYFSLNQSDKALKIIQDAPAHRLLAADIWFHEKKWDEATPLYEQALEQWVDTPQEPDLKSEVINKLSICYAMNHDNDHLSALKEKQGSFMAKSKNKDLFDFLTNTLPVSSKKINQQLEEASKTLDFLTKIYPR